MPGARLSLALIPVVATVMVAPGCGPTAAKTPEQALAKARDMQEAIAAGEWQAAERHWHSLHDSLHSSLLSKLPAPESQAAHQAAHRLSSHLQVRDRSAAEKDLAELNALIRQIRP